MMKFFKKIYIILLWGNIILLPHISFGQLKSFKFEEIDSLQKIDKRNIVIFIHTDWCKYCQKMKYTTFKNLDILNLLNQKFYFIDFNAEEKRNIKYKGYTFKFKPTGNNTGINELTEQLATIENKISYPSLCILNTDNEIIFQYDGYLSAKELGTIFKTLK